jgi:pimeloyl-ACP methyl ester carboxylesterase
MADDRNDLTPRFAGGWTVAMQYAHGIEYETHGEGEPVLLIHGAIVADSFAPIMDQPVLSDFRLIRYRRRGYGRSEPPRGSPTIEEQAHDAHTLLRHLHEQRSHVVAHSGGGPIAVQLALDAPELVRSLVLLEPALMNAAMAAGFAELIAPLIEMHRSGNRGKAVHMWMRSGAGSGWRDELEKWIPGVGDRANHDAAGTFEYDLAAMRHWDFDAVGATQIKQPVLYIVGSRTAAGHQAVTNMFRAAVPHTELAVIPDCDHSLQMTQPALVAQSMAEFLRRHPTDVTPRSGGRRR